jgi:uncharacterized protein YprB with RNaseH-like and TPR domain
MTTSDLHEQLRRLGVSRGLKTARSGPRRPRRPIEALLPGEIVDTRHGHYFLHRETYQLDHCHGDRALSDLLGRTPQSLSDLARDHRLAGVEFQRMAFVDTETTGLAGGTGTYAFLVGVGVFDADRFTIHQFFMRDYAEEPAQLHDLGRLLDGLDAIVSFNGKSFDMPLLETRFIMTRQPPRMVGAPHLDLLPTARRFWKYRLESCSLSSLESEVLGVERTHADVPGWLIPGLYADYARSGDAREMPRIFYHNAQDILSLVTLAARQCDLLATQPELASHVPGEDLYGLGRLLHDLGHPERAEPAFAQAAKSSHSPGVRRQAMRDLAYLLKRQERRQEALTWWRELVDSSGEVYACEELAKHYEWQDEDLAQALTWTQKAVSLARAWPAGHRRRNTLDDLDHRLNRLERKLRSPHDGDDGTG